MHGQRDPDLTGKMEGKNKKRGNVKGQEAREVEEDGESEGRK